MSHEGTRSLSAEDRAAIAADLAAAAELSGIADPPDVALVSVVSAADWPSTQVDCLRDAGYTTAALTRDGSGITAEIPAEQQDAYDLAAYTCAAKYPLDPAQYESRMTREQKVVAYEYLTVTLVDCLAEHGFTVTGIPSEETFLASWDTDQWNPYTQLRSTGGPDEDVTAACPMNPPPELIWGD